MHDGYSCQFIFNGISSHQFRMPPSPIPVRRNQASIASKHRSSHDSRYGSVISDHIDRQRRHVLELEAEALWLESEIRSLKTQSHELEKSIAKENESVLNAETVSGEIRSVTASIVLVCTAYMSHQKESEMFISAIANREREKGMLLPLNPLPVTVLDGQFTVVVDVPPTSHSMSDYLKKVDEAVHELVEATAQEIVLFSATQDQVELDALRIIFHLSHELADKLSSRVEELAELSSDQYSTKERFLMNVARTFVFDGLEIASAPTSPAARSDGRNSPAKKFATRQASPKPKEIKSTLGLPKRSAGGDSPPPEKTSSDVTPSSEEALPPSPSVKDRVNELERRNRRDDTASVGNSTRGTELSSTKPNVRGSLASTSKDERNIPTREDAPTINSVTLGEAKTGWGVKAPTPDRRSSIPNESSSAAGTFILRRTRPNELSNEWTTSESVANPSVITLETASQLIDNEPGSPSSISEKKEVKKSSWFSRAKK